MIRLFNHWFSWRSAAGMLFDLSFLFVSLAITLMWVHSDLPINPQHIIIYASLFAIAMLCINGVLGLYQRLSIRASTETRARVVLSLYLAIPVAYLLYALLPLAAVNRELIHLSAMSAVFGMLVTRVGAALPLPQKCCDAVFLFSGLGTRHWRSSLPWSALTHRPRSSASSPGQMKTSRRCQRI
jgi:hypothetical protein